MKPNFLCHWQDIAESSSKGFSLAADSSIFAVKKNQQLFIYKNSCPHLGIELEWLEDQFLDIDNNLIQCSTHGALFIIESGLCVAGPCLKQNLIPVSFTVDEQQRVFIDEALLITQP